MRKYISSFLLLSLFPCVLSGGAFALTLGKKWKSQKPATDSGKRAAAAPEACPGKAYLGHYDNAGYDIGLLVCLDSESKTGTTFLPPSMQRLSDVRWTTDGHVGFTSASPTRPVHFSFEGKSSESTIDGTIKLEDTETKEVRETHLKLSPLEKSELKTSETRRYSNAHYYEEAGDLVGADLLLFSENGDLTGVAGFYVGYWGEPDHVPLFVSNIKKSPDGNFVFHLSFEGKSKEYLAKHTPSGLIVAPTHLETWEMVRKITLKKTQPLIPPLFPLAQ